MSEATLTAPPSPWTSRRLVCFPTNISSQNNFGLIRLSLALLVVFSHSYAISTGTRPGYERDFLARLTHMQVDFGALAVDWFFTISGFLIASSWLQTKDFRTYLRKRALRIFPGLIGAVLFCILIVGPLAGVHLAAYFRDPNTYRFAQVLLLRDAFHVRGLPGVFQDNPFPGFVDGSLWTIRYEFLCYLLIPILALCGLLKRRWVLLAVFLPLVWLFHHFSSGFCVAALNHGQPLLSNSLSNMPRVVLFFLAGVTFYCWRDRIPRSPALLFLALAALALSRGHGGGTDCYYRRLSLTLPVAGPYIILYVAYAKSVLPQLSRLAQKHDLSYGVYLFGFPVQQLLVHYAQTNHVQMLDSPMGDFCAAVPLTLGLALLSWKCIEQPCLKFKASRRTKPASDSVSLRPTVDVPLNAGIV